MKTKRRNLFITDADYAYLKRIGGTCSEGVRRAVEAHKWLSSAQRAGLPLKSSRDDERGEG